MPALAQDRLTRPYRAFYQHLLYTYDCNSCNNSFTLSGMAVFFFFVIYYYKIIQPCLLFDTNKSVYPGQKDSSEVSKFGENYPYTTAAVEKCAPLNR